MCDCAFRVHPGIGCGGEGCHCHDPERGGVVLTDDEVRDLAYAVVRYYGYTVDDIAAAEAVHPGTVCGEECYDEDGRTVHSAAWVELGQTASVMVEVVVPFVAGRVAEVTEERDRLRRGGAELGKSLLFWMELARKVTESDDLIEDDGDGDWGAVAERMTEIPARLAEVAALRGQVEAVRALAGEAIAAVGGSHSHWREGGAGGVCRTCEVANRRQDEFRARLAALDVEAPDPDPRPGGCLHGPGARLGICPNCGTDVDEDELRRVRGDE